MALFKKKVAPATQPAASSEHAVIIHYKLSDDAHGTVEEREAIFALETRMEAAITAANAGEFDGNEFGGGEAVLYMYGPDRDRLWAAVEPQVRAFALRPAFADLRAGGPDSAAERLHF